MRPVSACVVFVADVPKVSRFYAALADMTTRHEDADHVVLGLDGFELVVHALRGAPIAPGGGTVEVREDSYFKICLPVASIAAARVRAAELGGAIRPPDAEWTARGFRACDGHDPEGNVLQVREPA